MSMIPYVRLLFKTYFLDHMTSAVILALSFAGRWYAPKLGVTRVPFTVSILCVPTFYFLGVHLKEKRFSYTSSPRKTFEENLEFYPVTRRAWNRAVAIRNAEIAASGAANKSEWTRQIKRCLYQFI